MAVTHVVWDWNGTLLDDFDVMVEATSASCVEVLGRPVTAEEYRSHFARPVHLLYEGIFGRPVAPEEWHQINTRFHTSYAELVATAALVQDATLALRMVTDAGCTQSLLSMWLHDELVRMLVALGVESEFVRAEGLAAMSDGGSKHRHLLEHLDKLGSDLGRRIDPDSVLVVGDSLDDAAAAAQAGARCVLVEGGSHHPADLATAGVPVVGSLVDALSAGFALRSDGEC